MKTTTNLGLKKPEGTDIVNIDDINYNADIMDAEIGNIKKGVVKVGASGSSDTAAKLQTPRAISLNGDIIGNANFDGSANTCINARLQNSGVTTGSYTKVSVDEKGRVVAGSNPMTLAGYGITDALPASSYTATDVLNKLKTVHGEGSGLNADLLDGKDSTAFATAAQGAKADTALQTSQLNKPGGVASYDVFKSHLEDIDNKLTTSVYGELKTTNAEITSLLNKDQSMVKVGVKGKTLVNLLGVDGDCEDINRWNKWQTTITLDSSNKVFGSTGFKVTLTANMGNAAKPFIWDTTKYYCLSAYVKNGNSTGVAVAKDSAGGGVWKASNYITDTTKFTRVLIKFQPSDIKLNDNILLIGGNATGQHYYVDGVMLNEITQDEYNDTNYQIPDYVNSDMSVGEALTRVKVISKNLIDIRKGLDLACYSFINGNGFSIVGNNSIWARKLCNVILRPNTTYTISFDVNTIRGDKGFVIVGLYSNDEALDIGGFLINDSRGKLVEGKNVITFKTSPLTELYRLGFYGTFEAAKPCNISYSNVQLEEGTTGTGFEPYQESVVSITQSLKSLPCGVFDEITIDGKLIKRVEKIILDGSLDWNISGGGHVVGKPSLFQVHTSITNPYIEKTALLYRFDNKSFHESSTPDESFGFYNGDIYMNIPSSLSGWGSNYTPTKEEIKAYFNGHLPQSVVDTGITTFSCGDGTHQYSKTITGLIPNSEYYFRCNIIANHPSGGLYVNGLAPLGNWIKLNSDSNGSLTISIWSYIPNSSVQNVSISNAQLVKYNIISERYRLYYQLSQPIETILPKSLVAGVNGNLLIENDSSMWVKPEVNYQVADNLKANIDELMENLSKINYLLNDGMANESIEWIKPTLLSGWVNYLDGYQFVRFYKDKLGIVHIQGLVKGGVTGHGQTVFLLPKGYRPKETLIFAQIGAGSTRDSVCRIDITFDGRVVPVSAEINAYMSLNISFRAEQ